MKPEFLFRRLLGHTVESLSRVTLIEGESSTVLNDTLVFTTAEGESFELLRATPSIFEEVTTEKGLLADLALEPRERLGLTPVNGQLNPFGVASITEIWAGEGASQFFVGAILWNTEREALIAICTETDEVEIMAKEELNSRIESMTFDYHCLVHRWMQTETLGQDDLAPAAQPSDEADRH